MRRSFINTQVKDPELARVQSNVELSLRSLSEVPLLDGRLIKGLEFTGNTTLRVQHRLGRPFNGYIVVSTNEKVVLKIVDSENQDPAQYIPLQTNTYDATISLWVF